MDLFNSKGTSWADQWDPVQDPPANGKDKKPKEGSVKGKGAMKSIFTLAWMKNLGKKSNK